MLTADAIRLPSGEWVLQVMDGERAVEAIALETTEFPPASSHHRLIEHGYMPDGGATLSRDRWCGWAVTDYGYSMEVHRAEE